MHNLQLPCQVEQVGGRGAIVVLARSARGRHRIRIGPPNFYQTTAVDYLKRILFDPALRLSCSASGDRLFVDGRDVSDILTEQCFSLFTS